MAIYREHETHKFQLLYFDVPDNRQLNIGTSEKFLKKLYYIIKYI